MSTMVAEWMVQGYGACLKLKLVDSTHMAEINQGEELWVELTCSTKLTQLICCLPNCMLMWIAFLQVRGQIFGNIVLLVVCLCRSTAREKSDCTTESLVKFFESPLSTSGFTMLSPAGWKKLYKTQSRSVFNLSTWYVGNQGP